MLSLDTERTPPANEVVYMQVGTGSQILMDLGIHKMRLLSAPFKFSGISGFELKSWNMLAIKSKSKINSSKGLRNE